MISRTVASANHKGDVLVMKIQTVEYESIEVNIFFHIRLSHYEITQVLYFMVDQQPPVSVITFQKVKKRRGKVRFIIMTHVGKMKAKNIRIRNDGSNREMG